MKSDIELQTVGSRKIHTQYLAENCQMARRAHRQILGKPLDNAKYQCVQNIHRQASFFLRGDMMMATAMATKPRKAIAGPTTMRRVLKMS